MRCLLLQVVLLGCLVALTSGCPTGGGTSPAVGTNVPASSPQVENRPDPPEVETPPADHAAGPSQHAGSGYGSKGFDPIAVNGPIFVDWPQPVAALVITGEQMGYIEPCGCAGLENQKGGLARRATLLTQLRDQGWPLAVVDLGGIVKRMGRQQEIKFETAASAMREMGYQAIGLTAPDLRLDAGTVTAVAAEDDGSPSRFVAANVGLFDFDSGFTSKYRVIEAGGKRFGVTAVLGSRQQADVQNEQVVLAPPAEALARLLPELEAQQCDVLVLLCAAYRDETLELARQFPQFQVVVFPGADEPPLAQRTIEGTQTLLVETGHKGMYAVVLGWFDDQAQPIRYQRVPLDSRFADAPSMRQRMAQYQDQLKQEGLVGLGVSEKIHPRSSAPGDARGKFVGSQACGDCHSTAFEIWSNTPHSHATETLVDLKPPRHFDPECLSCHVTGWNPQEYFPYESGFLALDRTPHLTGNGCENCHGPGAAHVAAETDGADDDLLRTLREAMRLTKAQAEQFDCKRCHDLDNSPEFNFETYWPQVEHIGRD